MDGQRAQGACGASAGLAEQLHTALNRRILVEQAKGVLAERAGVGVDGAFRPMRAPT